MMEQELARVNGHPEGDAVLAGETGAKSVTVDTFGGSVKVAWDSDAPMTPFGQMVFFVQFLKTSGLYSPWVTDCPIVYESPNSPTKTDVLGTALLSIVAGHWRYAHASTVRCDTVSPGLLGMKKVVSEDSLRRAFLDVDLAQVETWQATYLRRTYEPLLFEPYVLDLDTTVKPLYGKQQGAVVGYNPAKPGRPSHVFHTYLIANLRLVLDVEVRPGNEMAACYTQPGLWRFIDSLPRQAWPAFVRGDIAFGNESMMASCEDRGLDYLFKLRMTRNARELVKIVSCTDQPWTDAGQGWEGTDSRLTLNGWTKTRRVVILRRRLTEPRKKPRKNSKGEQFLPFLGTVPCAENYEYAILVTSKTDPIYTLAQHYRDRGDAENNFDELKNQWGWGGFTTQDIARTQIMARITAQVYNWWTIFARLAVPDKHIEGITSRPLLLHSIGRTTCHGGQTTIHLTSMHAKRDYVQQALTSIGAILRHIATNAEQLAGVGIWRLILSRAFAWFLRGRLLSPPPFVKPSPPGVGPPPTLAGWTPALLTA